MAQARGHRFTIYDAMEASGAFDSNPANAFSRSPMDGSSLYVGPVAYPKMLYHPHGEERVIVPAEIISTPMGAKEVGEQREMIYMTVANQEEHDVASAEGWHDHPAKALRARVEARIADSPELSERERAKLMASIPKIVSVDRIAHLEAELARLQALQAGEQKPKAVAVASPSAPLKAKTTLLPNGLPVPEL